MYASTGRIKARSKLIASCLRLPTRSKHHQRLELLLRPLAIKGCSCCRGKLIETIMIYGGRPDGTDAPALNQPHPFAARSSRSLSSRPLTPDFLSSATLACPLRSTAAPACSLGNAARRAPSRCRVCLSALPPSLLLRELHATPHCPVTQLLCPHRRRGRRRRLLRGRWSFSGSEPPPPPLDLRF
jgi:hypothetical protein